MTATAQVTRRLHMTMKSVALKCSPVPSGPMYSSAMMRSCASCVGWVGVGRVTARVGQCDGHQVCCCTCSAGATNCYRREGARQREALEV